MFTLFTFIFSAICGMLAYRFAGNHIAAKATPVSAKTEFITKTIFSIVGGFVGLILASILYGILKIAIPLAIVAGIIYLAVLYRREIKNFLATGRL